MRNRELARSLGRVVLLISLIKMPTRHRYTLPEIKTLRASVLSGWRVPEIDHAAPVIFRRLTICHVATERIGDVEIVPFTNGDIPMAKFIEASPDIVDQLLARTSELSNLNDDLLRELVSVHDRVIRHQRRIRYLSLIIQLLTAALVFETALNLAICFFRLI